MLSPDITRAEADTVRAVIVRLGYRGYHARRLPLPRYPIVHGSYISRTTYLRFCFDDKVVAEPFLLYIDADILVMGDMLAPFDTLHRGSIAVVRDEFNHTIGIGPALPKLSEDCPELRGRPYFNAGVLWTTVGILPRLNRGANAALSQRKYIHFNDQDALNIWLHATGTFTEVDGQFNRFELDRFRQTSDWVDRILNPTLSRDGVAAVHFVGALKPWLSTCPQTSAVRLYGATMRTTQRLIARTKDTSLSFPSKLQHESASHRKNS
jgi:lipopolysaccharide biosynthesis glycosyltransferase